MALSFVPTLSARVIGHILSEETHYLFDTLEEETTYPGTYYPEVIALTCAVVDARQYRNASARATDHRYAEWCAMQAERAELVASEILYACALVEPQHEPNRSARAYLSAVLAGEVS